MTSDTSRAPAFPPTDWRIGETRMVPSHRPELSDNHITRTSETAYVGFNFYRPLTELPPIEDTAMQSTYPAAQARVHTAHLCRTPIDPVTQIKGLVMKGNTDLQPAAWNPPEWLKPLIGGVED